MSAPTRKIILTTFGLILFAAAPAPANAADDVFVAGVEPSQRPASAPRLMVAMHPQAWYVRAVRGVIPPYPQSLFFLDNQGDWYTPFNRPGMPGPYDIRGWHKAN